ncbi:CbrC family protein [Persicimonas caeni]|uniref:CbrC family protein n=1 Tax=Persicimonas caeni TaxID=2292766 RepID=A0A4Y6Q0M2_PERCE|nr:CbrC family protein [Persicimonas caeni]QDG53545.1 CbrC family protein [Persicimonas caeni]QED34766.1 CbrC family protein [Persicimonas caeni]
MQRPSGHEVHVPLAVVRKLISDLIHTGDLRLRARRDTVEHLHARQTLGEDLRDWIQARIDVNERSAQKEAVAEMVDWLLERPELDDLFMADVDLYWMLRRRVWDIRDELAAGGADQTFATVGEADSSHAGEQTVVYTSPVTQKKPQASRFKFLGIDFPLFGASVDEASSYVGSGFCCVRQEKVEHAFELGISDYLCVSCDACGRDNFLDASDRASQPCRECGVEIAFPPFPDETPCIGYEALRAGGAALTKDTEFGMITWENAENGVTHGVPWIDPDRVEDVDIVELEEGWHAARLDPDDMWELLRTPSFVSWQGEFWLFSGGHPMVYVGAWTRVEFCMHAEDGKGEALFNEVVEDLPERDLWPELEPDGSVAAYVFRCPETGRLRASWDMP